MQLSSRSYSLIMLVQIAVLLPLMNILPIWTTLVATFTFVWYWLIHIGRTGLPAKPLVWLVGVSSIVGIAVHYPSPLALEPMVALSACAFIFKLLELHNRRDVWVLVLVAYFLIACQLLFRQNFTVLPLIAAQLIGVLLLQQSLFRKKESTSKLLKLSSLIVLQSIPLMLFLFLVFPRLGPLWMMPGASQQAVTGMSDTMEPGKVGRLARSGELAFRVEFEGNIPVQKDLYWRGLVLEDFDGQRWTRNKNFIGGVQPRSVGGTFSRYTIILQSGNHQWLKAIAPAKLVGDDVFLTNRREWWLKRPVNGRYSYTAESHIGGVVSETSRRWAAKRNLSLPDNGNPLAKEIGARWQAQGLSFEQTLNAAEQFYRERPYRYTLTPPVLGEDGIDEFLLETKAGFCEHFAGSYVYLMRAAGVPARVVLGYQGGERNFQKNYLLVHQSDAHAWAEVLHPSKGWIRVDPVGFVAPERIEQESSSFFEKEPEFLAEGGFSLRRFRFFNNLRLWLDNVDFVWAKWVLSYDQGAQWQVLNKLLGQVNAGRILVFFSVVVLMPVFGVLLYNRWRYPKKPNDPLVVAYITCCARLKRFGLEKLKQETPRAFCLRVSKDRPSIASWIEQVTQAFEFAAYRQPSKQDASLRRLKQLRRSPVEI